MVLGLTETHHGGHLSLVSSLLPFDEDLLSQSLMVPSMYAVMITSAETAPDETVPVPPFTPVAAEGLRLGLGASSPESSPKSESLSEPFEEAPSCLVANSVGGWAELKFDFPSPTAVEGVNGRGCTATACAP
jgi:hypothetical protein